MILLWRGEGGLDLDLEAVKAHKPPGGCTMASLATLHLGQPCHMRCTPKALDSPWAGLGCYTSLFAVVLRKWGILYT